MITKHIDLNEFSTFTKSARISQIPTKKTKKLWRLCKDLLLKSNEYKLATASDIVLGD